MRLKPILPRGFLWFSTASFWVMTSAFIYCVSIGCDGSDDDFPEVSDIDPESTEPIEMRNVAVIENPKNALSYVVEWETSIPASTQLKLTCDEEISHTYTSHKSRRYHSVFVMGLLDGISCDIELESDLHKRSGSAKASIERVGPLPDFLPKLNPRIIDRERMQSGWTLWTLGQFSASGPVYVIVTDEQGRYRWYLLESTDRRFADNELLVIPEGILLGGGSTKILNWEGDVIWKPPFESHHDITVSTFHKNHFLYLGVSSKGCDTTEGTANEFDRRTQKTVWTWYICEHFTPRLDYKKWSHINAIEPFPDERAVLLSPRDQNALIKVDRDSDEVVWVLGENGDFEMDDADRFYRQHAPEFQPSGNILIFDNGLSTSEASQKGDGKDKAREYSRAIELELIFDHDGEPLRAEKVWEYRDESLFSKSRSEADRLPNGNTLITYSALEEDFSTLMREVTTDGEVVWELRAPADRSTYRSERLTEQYFGYVRDESD